jgi:hypothetical protein
MLITATSLVAVVGGWAGFTIHQSYTSDQKDIKSSDDSSQVSLELPPLPTLVPEPSSTPGHNTAATIPGLAPVAAAPVHGLPVPTPVVVASSGGNSSSNERAGKNDGQTKPDPVTDTRTS